MSIEEIKEFIRSRPGYLKVGPDRLADRLRCDYELCKAALTSVKQESKVFSTSAPDRLKIQEQVSPVLTEFQEFLKDNGIEPGDVSSAKFWQTAAGKLRFSVATKNDPSNVDLVKQDIEAFAEAFSPGGYQLNRGALTDPIAYEISLPDIHYGKLTSHTLQDTEEQFLSVVSDLVGKAAGLNIELFVLPIGNDGMNSEGMRQSTTKGTPQHDSGGWKETYTGYWRLMVAAIEALKEIAPVHVVVISGNHDYERMYYAGDTIAGWYRNDPEVTVDNSGEPRKYFEYGNNMIMYTHGDSEKPADMPLIMATEKPEMFARCSHREAHCGHFHKEQVNEYRGVKVRFIPSICPTDEWHKKMGYHAKRTGQAYIWNKSRGLEGYLQSNVT